LLFERLTPLSIGSQFNNSAIACYLLDEINCLFKTIELEQGRSPLHFKDLVEIECLCCYTKDCDRSHL
jgi:hypothetical protein